MRILLAASSLAVAAVAVAFALRNAEPVRVDLLLARPELPLALWLVLFLCAGVAIGLVLPLRGLLRSRRHARRLSRENRRLQERTAPPARDAPTAVAGLASDARRSGGG